jgi:hypothetical protein
MCQPKEWGGHKSNSNQITDMDRYFDGILAISSSREFYLAAQALRVNLQAMCIAIRH